jgi:hypothetical protein
MIFARFTQGYIPRRFIGNGWLGSLSPRPFRERVDFRFGKEPIHFGLGDERSGGALQNFDRTIIDAPVSPRRMHAKQRGEFSGGVGLSSFLVLHGENRPWKSPISYMRTFNFAKNTSQAGATYFEVRTLHFLLELIFDTLFGFA